MKDPIWLPTLTNMSTDNGQAIRLWNLIAQFAKEREVHLLCPKVDGPNKRRCRGLAGYHSILDRPFSGRGYFSLAFYFELGRIFKRINAIVEPRGLIYTDTILLTNRRKSFRHDLPVVLEVNGIAHEENISKGYYGPGSLIGRVFHRVERKGIGNADRIICVTEGLKGYLTAEMGIDGGKVSVIGNGVDTKMFDPGKELDPPAEFERYMNRARIVFVSGFRPWHGVDNLIRSVEIASRKDDDIMLFLIGKGPELDASKDLVHDLRLDGWVVFLGEKDQREIPRYVQHSDLSVYFPNVETSDYVKKIGLSSMKLYEYMAMEKPVVTVDVMGLGQIVKDEGCGLVTPPDREKFAEAILELLGNGKRMKEMGRRGRRAIETKYTWKNIATRIETEFEGLQ